MTRDFYLKVNTFKLKYNTVPGKLINYTQFFTALVGPYCPRPNFIPEPLDGVIDQTYEAEAAFAQLHAAGMIEMGRPQILSDGTVQDHYDCWYNGMLQRAGLTISWPDIYAALTKVNGKSGLIW